MTRYSNSVKHYVDYAAIAISIAWAGMLIGGDFGMLLKMVGLGGVLSLGVMMAFTGDVVGGKRGGLAKGKVALEDIIYF